MMTNRNTLTESVLKIPNAGNYKLFVKSTPNRYVNRAAVSQSYELNVFGTCSKCEVEEESYGMSRSLKDGL